MEEIPTILIQLILLGVYQRHSDATFIISPVNTPADEKDVL
jgi:hypothetical protein